MDFDVARAAVLVGAASGGDPGGSVGDGLVARYPGVVCVARCAEPALLHHLLDLCAAAAGPDPGRTLARSLARWLASSDDLPDRLVFGTVSAAGEQLAVFLSGAVRVEVGDLALAGTDAAAWTDRLLPVPDSPVLLVLSGAAVATAAARTTVDGLLDLRSGVVPGSGVVVRVGGSRGAARAVTAERLVVTPRPVAAAVSPVGLDRSPLAPDLDGNAARADSRSVPAPAPPDVRKPPPAAAAPAEPEPPRAAAWAEADGQPEGRPDEPGVDEEFTSGEWFGAVPGAAPPDDPQVAAAADAPPDAVGMSKAAQNGATGAAPNGAVHTGAGQDGTGQDGTGQDGTGQDGTGQDGSDHAGVEQVSPAAAVAGHGEAEQVWVEPDASGRPGSGRHAVLEPNPAPRPGNIPAPAPAPVPVQAVDDVDPPTPRDSEALVAVAAAAPAPGRADVEESTVAAPQAVPAPRAAPKAPRRAEPILGVAPAEPQRIPLADGPAVGSSAPATGHGAVAAPAADDRQQARGHMCARGHLNDPRSHFCVLCGIRMNERTGVLVVGARPPLGLLVFDDGATYTVDAEYLVGRMPESDQRVISGALRAIVVDDRSGAVSRVHAEIRLDGWDVLLTDSGSRNGTFVAGPNQQGWTPLPPGRTRRLVPGTRVRMGGRTFVFESPSGVR